MSKQYCLICNSHPKEYDDYYISLSGCDTTSSSVIYSNSLLRGLMLNGFSFNVISAASVGHYPLTSKTRRVKEVLYDKNYYGVGYNNFVGVSQFSKTRAIIKSFNKNIKPSLKTSGDDDLNIIVSDIHAPFLKAALKIKKRFKNAKIVLVCLDLPQNVKSSSHNILLRCLKKISSKQIVKLSKRVDGYVYLSQYMKEKFGDKEKKSLVLPGILDTSIYENIKKVENKVTTYVYCGVLSKQYNIDFLLKSFELIKEKDCRLVLAGKGDLVDEIKKLEKIDSRISYLGEISRDSAYRLQKNADVLVNPRLPSYEYTKLSFPSKTLSYLFSGNPLVCYVLECFPNDIASVVVEPKKKTEKAFADALIKAKYCKISNQVDTAMLYSEKRVVEQIDNLFLTIRNNYGE